jgi:hypothetical protein
MIGFKADGGPSYGVPGGKVGRKVGFKKKINAKDENKVIDV